ncbi:hypothetical protein NDU88_004777, partial [Pleurodeles waltl]
AINIETGVPVTRIGSACDWSRWCLYLESVLFEMEPPVPVTGIGSACIWSQVCS